MKTGELSETRLLEIRRKLESIPFAQLLGIELEQLAPGVVTLGLEISERLKRNNGIAHGGAIASLLDTASAFAIISLLEPEQRSTTVDLTVHFLRPLSEGRATATAKVVRAGRRIITVSAEAHGPDGKLVATALSTFIRD
jgi:acyl-CoA thioesterase